MNTLMWQHPFTAQHLRALRALGFYHVVNPMEKLLACKDYGWSALCVHACANLLFLSAHIAASCAPSSCQALERWRAWRTS